MFKKAQSNHSHATKVRLIRGGQEYFQLLESMVDQAKHSIYFQMYIFDEDDTGRSVARALMGAARRNVVVHLLLDNYASQHLSDSFVHELIDSGIHFQWFTSFIKNKKFYLGRRLHHKVIIVDSMRGLVGGLNISDRYNDTVKSIAWLDWAVYSEGDVAIKLGEVCKKRIKNFSKHSLDYSPQIRTSPKNESAVKICVNDWVGRKTEITRSYLDMLKNATSTIIMMSPYFLPGKRIRKGLRLASKRGVKICLILAGISDVPMAKYAERYLYEWLFKNDIQIYEYKKTVLHGKISVCDGNWVTVGSYNVNNLSAYVSIELNLEIKNETFARHAEQRLQSIIETECIHITELDYERKINFLTRIFQTAAYNALRLVLFLFATKTQQHG